MIGERFRSSASFRLLIIGVLSLLLLIPTSMIIGLISERESARDSAVQEVGSKWGRHQVIAGPVLTVPYKKYYRISKNKVGTTTKYAHFLPEKLVIDGTLHPEIRYRGIYEVILYNSRLNISGSFPKVDMTDFDIPKENIVWKDAFVAVGISDMKGIKDTIRIKWNGSELNGNPGIESADILQSGIAGKARVDDNTKEYRFSFDLNLNGSQGLDFIPLGKETKVALSSTWNSPSFKGEFLPESREISEKGFSAKWNILHLNRNYPQQWLGKSFDIFTSAFGVDLLMPVNEYQKTTRTTKYALMFIVLTFLSFFLIEIFNRKAIHPIQYLMIGLALVVFYSLLLSLSEHMLFKYSYLIAGSFVVFLISAYSRSVLGSGRLSTLIGGILSVFYTFLYVILQLEDYALLLGSAGLFVILALLMYLTRKINWFTVLESGAEG